MIYFLLCSLVISLGAIAALVATGHRETVAERVVRVVLPSVDMRTFTVGIKDRVVIKSRELLLFALQHLLSWARLSLRSLLPKLISLERGIEKKLIKIISTVRGKETYHGTRGSASGYLRGLSKFKRETQFDPIEE